MAEAAKKTTVADAAKKTDTTLTVEGKIVLDPIKSDQPAMHMTVEWTVKKADGAILGVVAQKNDVPLSLLQSPWAPLANAVAQGGAEGVSAFTQRAP